jgi:diacylglycerol kinase family enzyme
MVGVSLIAAWQNAFLIYNPLAGKFNRESGRLLQRTIDAIAAQGHRVTAMPTRGPRTAGAIAQECVAGGADLVISAGGDGTINEIANGMIGSTVPLAILPGGTANVLSVEIGLGTRLVEAAERLSEMVPARIAAGRLETSDQVRHFLLMAGVGFDAMIVYSVDAQLKQRIGRAAYWVGGFSQLGKPLPEFDVRINDSSARCSFALASRVRNYGGDLWIARGASLFNEQFEFVLFEGKDTLPYLRYLFGVITGRLSGMSGVSVVSAESAIIECPGDERIYVQIDGEYGGRLPAKLSIVPSAITLMMPPTFRDRHHRQGSNG